MGMVLEVSNDALVVDVALLCSKLRLLAREHGAELNVASWNRGAELAIRRKVPALGRSNG